MNQTRGASCFFFLSSIIECELLVTLKLPLERKQIAQHSTVLDSDEGEVLHMALSFSRM